MRRKSVKNVDSFTLETIYTAIKEAENITAWRVSLEFGNSVERKCR